jgi:beta-galactosidase
VPVAAVETGSNAADAAYAADDDETTKWTSKPGEGEPALTFKLARSATLSEVVLKLAGWRVHSYPLKVFVDGNEVYSGVTPKSLGYVTLPLKAVRGSTVRIVLNGAADDANAIQLIEVANQANVETGSRGAPSGALSIVEAEFYER